MKFHLCKWCINSFIYLFSGSKELQCHCPPHLWIRACIHIIHWGRADPGRLGSGLELTWICYIIILADKIDRMKICGYTYGIYRYRSWVDCCHLGLAELAWAGLTGGQCEPDFKVDSCQEIKIIKEDELIFFLSLMHTGILGSAMIFFLGLGIMLGFSILRCIPLSAVAVSV